MSTSEIELAETLEKAADVIRVNGWHQGDLWPDGPETQWKPGLPVCAVGSLEVVTGNQNLRKARSDLCSRACKYLKFRRLRGVHLYVWNDHTGRAATEVIELFLNAAKDLRNQGSEDGHTGN